MKDAIEDRKLNFGTTTVGVLGKEAVVLAADMKATLGNIVSDTNISKIYRINNRIAITIAGGVGDALTVVRFLQSHARLFEIERESPMTTKALITFLSNILNSNRYFPFQAFFIVGGYNNKPELYTSDLVGGFNEVDKFTSTGSGFELAYGFLEEEFKEGLSTEKATEIAVKAVKVAKKRDIYTGGDSVKVFVISKDGAKELARKEVEKYLTA